MKKSDVKIVVKDLDNKRQKGKYLYLKSPGKRGRYFKADGSLTINEIKEYYIAKNEGRINVPMSTYRKVINKSKEGSRKSYRTKNVKINNAMKKGIYRCDIKDALSVGNNEINRAMKRLVAPAAKSKKIAELLMNEQNAKKFRTNIEVNISLIGNENEVLASVRSIGKKTLREAVIDAQTLFKTGKRVEPSYKELQMRASEAGYKLSYKGKEGFVNRVKMSFVLRK